MISMSAQGIIREEKWNLQEMKMNDSYAKLRGQDASTRYLMIKGPCVYAVAAVF